MPHAKETEVSLAWIINRVTLMNILARFFDPLSGTVIDNDANDDNDCHDNDGLFQMFANQQMPTNKRKL